LAGVGLAGVFAFAGVFLGGGASSSDDSSVDDYHIMRPLCTRLVRQHQIKLSQSANIGYITPYYLNI